MHIIGVAGVVWYGETAVTDGHLAFTKRQREEAQFVQQTSQSLQEQTECKPVTQTGTNANNKPESALLSPHRRPRGRLTHPNIGFGGDDLVVVKIHHLGGSVGQRGVPAGNQDNEEDKTKYRRATSSSSI